MVAAFILAIVTVYVGTRDVPEGEEPNRLATSLLQGITLIFGTYGSFILGKVTTKQAAAVEIRLPAKSAFRRVQNLYQGLGRLKQIAESEALALEGREETGTAAGMVSIDMALASLDKIRLVSTEQIATADDALEDWRDLAPEEVAKVLAAADSETARESTYEGTL